MKDTSAKKQASLLTSYDVLACHYNVHPFQSVRWSSHANTSFVGISYRNLIDSMHTNDRNEKKEEV